MAILTGPLGSLGARGKLGNFLVGFKWKDKNVARVYVIPANPRTKLQREQRSILSDGVLEWHQSLFTEDDYAAWRKLASLAIKGETGMNQMIRKYIEVLRAAGTWRRLRDIKTEFPPPHDAEISCDALADYGAIRVRYGTNIRYFVNDVPVVWNAVRGRAEYDIAAGTFIEGDRVYFQFYNGADYPSSDGISGISYYDQP